MAEFSRRQMLSAGSCGFGALAFSGLSNALMATQKNSNDLKARAKRVIFLCMPGGPAHLDTFDYKPQITKAEHPGSAFKFSQHGKSGLWVSELFPELAKHADKLCVLNGMYADTGNHAQSFRQMQTGERLRSRPSIGSWVNYGLGTENDNLPGFISLNSHESFVHSSSFLPSRYSGTPIGVNGESMSEATIPNVLSNHLSKEVKHLQLDVLQSMNRNHLSFRNNDDALEGAIESMELGFRMQMIAPDLMDVSTESADTLERYRVGKNIKLGTCRPSDFGRQCLLARRFAEAGVRYIQVSHNGWDQHKNHRRDLRANCESTDAPIAALLGDLEQRGLMEDTLLIWGGEFGRPGLKPSDKKDETGHNANGFTFWLAGGAVKGGHVHGKTDSTGAKAVEGRMHFHDLHATVLHILGISHDNLTFSHQGREHRLTGPDGGKVMKQILS
tara:strand:- start:5110 stop:6441 length:1332 start_codon:yes stop_codon:yes gene_type:complete